MKFPGIPLLFIFVVIFVIVAGCNSVPPSKETSPVPTSEPVTSMPEMTVSPLVTPHVSESATDTIAPLPTEKEIIIDPNSLTQLILLQTDFPSFVVSANGQFNSAKNMENSSPLLYGYQNGYLLNIVLEKDSSKVTQAVAIMDTKANASKIYDQLDAQYAPAVQIHSPNGSITANSVSIGDRGKMYVMKGIPPIDKWWYWLLFTRGNVFELITMEVPANSSYTEKVIIDIAKNADRRITIQPVPITSSTPNQNFKTMQTQAHTPIPTTIPTARTTDNTQVLPSPKVVVNPNVVVKTIEIKNFAFDPPTLMVKSGSAVMWTNHDGVPHAIVFDIGSPVVYVSGPLSPGSTYYLSFTQPGTYTYHCSIHPSMKGTIVVQN
jgi:amicyanin